MKEIHLLGLLLCIVILILCFIKYVKEGFALTNETMHDVHTKLMQQKYNNVGVALAATKTNGTNNVGSLGTNSRGMFGSVQDTVDESNNAAQYVDDPFPLEEKESGMALMIKQCEAVKTITDCSAFDNKGYKDFSTNCGLCLDIGTDSEGKPQTGGLVLTDKDKKYAQSQKKGNFLSPYVPTVGTCPTGMLVGTKAECLRLQDEIACKKGNTFDKPAGCAQCYNDGIYHVVDSRTDPTIVVGAGTIMVIGSGTLTWSETGQPEDTIELSPKTSKTLFLVGPEYTQINFTIEAPPVPIPYDATVIYKVKNLIIFRDKVYRMVEGAGAPGFDPSRPEDRLWEFMVDYSRWVPPPATFFAGYIQTPESGDNIQTLDLYRIIVSDAATGRKPRTINEITLNSIDVTKMGPGFGKKVMKLTAYSPFSYVDPFSQEASLCPNSPYITNSRSATLLGSDPCYAKGQSTPGTYNLECLQQIFLNNGCGLSSATLDRSGYPSTPAKAAALMTDSTGKSLAIDEIADKVYQAAVTTMTGRNSAGKSLSMTEWSAVSKFCSGIIINSPCDAVDEDGRLTNDCISYLWDNQGEYKKIGTGPTYTLASFARSLFSPSDSDPPGRINRFCTREGTRAPKNSKGEENEKNMEYWKKQGSGSVADVKKAMSQLHLNANSSLTAEDTRARAPNDFIQQCYGIVPRPRPDYTTSFQAVTGSTLPIANTIIKDDIILPDNYDFTLSFDITPYRIIPNSFGGILRISTATTPDTWPPGYGVRNTMFLFFPGSTALHFVIGNHDDLNDYDGWNWLGGINPSPFAELPLNEKTTISVKTAGRSVMITVAGVTKTYTQPTKRMYSRTPDEKYKFYVSDNSFPAANATVENIKYTVNGDTIVQTPSISVVSSPGQSM
jgi:hypothetical protein